MENLITLHGCFVAAVCAMTISITFVLIWTQPDFLILNYESINALPVCPLMPPNRSGTFTVHYDPLEFDELESLFPNLQNGGRYKPKDCRSADPIAIIIPYRNRERHLHILLRNLHEFLMDQQREYVVYVVTQTMPTKFNKAMLLDIGYTEITKRYNIQCFIFHDVDLLPLNDRLSYSCSDQPVHLSVAVDKFHYKLTYDALFGGVVAMTKKQITDTNGYSTVYFGWGQEDDDMSTRLKINGYKLKRYHPDIARYTMLKHGKDNGNEKNPDGKQYLKKTKVCYKSNGLNSLKYTLVTFEERKLFTWVEAFINETEVMNQESSALCVSAKKPR